MITVVAIIIITPCRSSSLSSKESKSLICKRDLVTGVVFWLWVLPAGPWRSPARSAGQSLSKGLSSEGLPFLTLLFLLLCKSVLCAKYLLTRHQEGIQTVLRVKVSIAIQMPLKRRLPAPNPTGWFKSHG